MTTLEPRPDFDWTKVRWTGPYALVDDTCSYCGQAIQEDELNYIPLRLWNEESWAAVFCNVCMKQWWGMETYDDPQDYGDERGIDADEE